MSLKVVIQPFNHALCYHLSAVYVKALLCSNLEVVLAVLRSHSQPLSESTNHELTKESCAQLISKEKKT